MSVKGRVTTDAGVLQWTGKLFSADDVRRYLDGHTELRVPAGTIVTPLALDELKTRGVSIVRGERAGVGKASDSQAANAWGYWLEKPAAIVEGAVQALAKEGLRLQLLDLDESTKARWHQSLGERISNQTIAGAVIFSGDAAWVCCASNRVPGLRAVVVVNALEVKRALAMMGANVLAVEPQGRTYFEVRQILRAAATTQPACPPDVASLLKELEGHAHR